MGFRNLFDIPEKQTLTILRVVAIALINLAIKRMRRSQGRMGG